MVVGLSLEVGRRSNGMHLLSLQAARGKDSWTSLTRMPYLHMGDGGRKMCRQRKSSTSSEAGPPELIRPKHAIQSCRSRPSSEFAGEINEEYLGGDRHPRRVEAPHLCVP